MKRFIDQLGRLVEIENVPQRIISLVPSFTELLFDLGLDDKILGVTIYCTKPKDKVARIPKIGGTKKLRINIIHELDPDLIIASKEENEKDQIIELELSFPIWIANVTDFASSIEAIKLLSEITNKTEKGIEIIQSTINAKEIINKEFVNSELHNKNVLYFIWRKPYMVVGKDTYINSIIEILGFKNCVLELDLDNLASSRSIRYITLADEELKKLMPDFIFLSTEPYPFQEKHFYEFLNLFPNSIITQVRGDNFSWYGSRFSKSLDYFINFKQHLLQKLNMKC
ncbi:MAG: ABC transporter substrate-binding protein [Candidatus Kapaibacteriales bacterium]